MRTLVILLLSALLTSCACVAKTPEPTSHDSGDVSVTLDFVVSWDGERYYLLLLFVVPPHADTAGCNAVIQEVEMQGGWNLVECFALVDGRNVWTDHHAGRGWRRMRVYLGYVEDVEWQGRFAQIPYNMGRTLKTNIPMTFNADYQWHYKTRGRVLSDRKDRCITTWRITPAKDALIVACGGVETRIVKE